MVLEKLLVTSFWRRLTALILVVCCCWILAACANKSTGDDDPDIPDDDITPPAAVTDLHVIQVTTATALLQWTAPGDDSLTGVAFEYDLRGALDSITEATFGQAIRIDSAPPPIPAGLTQQCLIEELTPGMTYYFALKSRDDAGNWSGLSNCTRADCPEDALVTFTDLSLEAIVRSHVAKPTGDILASDVDTVTELNANDAGITDITGLQHFTGLGILHLGLNDIADLTPLQGLTDLRALHIGTNAIADLSPISGLINLVQLSIGQNPLLTDISAVAGLVNLRTLRVNGSSVTDFSPIYGLSALEELDIHSNRLDSLTFLSGYPNLRVVTLTYTHTSDISPLAPLTSLEEVYLNQNAVVDVTAMSGLTNLKRIDLRDNQIVSILPLVNNSGLGTGDLLRLQNNPLDSMSIHEYIPTLQNRGVAVYF